MNQWSRWDEAATSAEPAWRWLAEALAMPALLATPPRPLAEMTLPAPRLPGVPREKLVALLGVERVRQEDSERIRHAAGSAAPDQLRLRTGDLSRAPDAVLYPRNQDEVLAVLRLCAENDIAVVPFGAGLGTGATPTADGPIVSCDMSAMAHLLSVDAMSGLAEAEAGITGTELNRQLGVHAMMLDGPQDASLGGFIAQNGGEISWLQSFRLATPKGLLESGLDRLVPGSQGALGIITSVSLRVQAVPERNDQRRYLFADFAGGLAAIREAKRQGLRFRAQLSDAAQTRFHDQLEQMDHRPDLRARLGALYRHLRHFDSQAAALAISFGGSAADVGIARRRFGALARRLGATPLEPRQTRTSTWRETLLDRGVAVERFETGASWAKLPGLYAGLRAMLDQAMRAHAPRAGARGLVLGRISDVCHEGASLRLTCIYPRALGNDVAQAEAIRQAGLEALAARSGATGTLDADLLRTIKQTLDPKDILNPGKRAF